MTRINNFHHVTIFAKETERTHHFYTEVLGLHLVSNTVHQERKTTRHLFYGDKLGSPGTLFTFFVYPRMKDVEFHKNYYGDITALIPQKTTGYWAERLQNSEAIITDQSEHSVRFLDPDGTRIVLQEADELIDADKATTHSDVPHDKQIIRIAGQDIHIKDVQAEKEFLYEWLGLSGSPAKIENLPAWIEPKENPETDMTRMGHGMIDHLALGVQTKEDVDFYHDRAKELGLTINMFKDRGFFKALYVQSPNGLRYEIASNEPGFKQLEDTRKLVIPSHYKDDQKEIFEVLDESL